MFNNVNGDSDKPLRVALYARVSSEEQKQGQNIQTQVEFANKYGNTFSLKVVECYLDEAISGTVPLHNRPAGMDMLEAAREKRFDIIIVYRLDRLARKLKVLLDAWEELDGLGIGIRSMTEPLDTSSPLGRFVMQLLGSIAELERETILERTRDGRESIVRRGYWPGGIPPMGYRIEHEAANGTAKGRGYLVEQVDEAETIRLIYKLYTEDKMSLANVSAYLNGRSVPTSTEMRKGEPSTWTAARIHSILRNPVYKGTFDFYRRKNQSNRDHVQGDSPPLVDEETWETAQRQLVDNLKASPRNMKRFYLLRGIPRCGLCGRTCVGTGRLKEGRSHYVCNGNRQENRMPRCPGVRIRAEALEELVWEDIKEFARTPGKVIDLLAKKVERESKQGSGIRQEIAKLDDEIQEIERRRHLVINQGSRGLISDEEAEAALLNTQREIQVIQNRRKTLAGQVQLYNMQETQVGQTEALLATLVDKVEHADEQSKRAMVEALVSEINLLPGENGGVKVGVTYRFGQLQEHITSPLSLRIT